MSKKKPVPAKKKPVKKTVVGKTAKSAPAARKKPLPKKPAAKQVLRPQSKIKTKARKPAAPAKPAAKPGARAPQPRRPLPKPKSKPAAVNKSKSAVAKKGLVGKSLSKNMKASVKPVKKPSVQSKPAPAKKKAPPAPAKPVSKKPAPAKPAPAKSAPAKPSAKKPAAKTSPVKGGAHASATHAKPAVPEVSSKKKGKAVASTAAAKSSDKGSAGKPVRPRKDDVPLRKPAGRPVRPAISFNLDDVREYLKQRQNLKLEAYVPESDTDKAAPAAPRKAAVDNFEIKTRDVGAVSVADILGFNPFKKEDPDREEDQIPPKWRKYYRLLIELRTNLQEGLSLHTEDALKKSGKEGSGDLSSYSQHMADAGTDSFDRDFALSLVSSEQEALAEISDALNRMRRGKYGVCEITGKPIPADRLTAVPFTRYSLEGQRELERNRRNRRRGGVLGNPLTELGDGVNFGSGEEVEEA